MASFWYQPGLKHFALGDVIWKASGGSTIKATLVDGADYTPSASHEYMNLDTVPAAAKVATGTLAVVDAAADGVLDAADLVLSAVSGDHVAYVLLWKDGGGGGVTQSGTDDLLLACFEAAATPNGGDITLQWGNVAGTLLAKI